MVTADGPARLCRPSSWTRLGRPAQRRVSPEGCNDTLLLVVRGRGCSPFAPPSVIGIDSSQALGVDLCCLPAAGRPLGDHAQRSAKSEAFQATPQVSAIVTSGGPL